MMEYRIKRIEKIGLVRLYLGDMREVLPLIDERADLCVSDPPYPLISGGNTTQSMGGIFAHAEYDNSGELMDMVPWHDMGGPIFRALKDDADCYIMSNDKNLFAAHAAFLGAGFSFHNLLTWDKVRATRNRWYMKNLEFTLYLWKGAADKAGINDCGSKQSFQLNAKRESGHPTEKPVELMAHYIKNSSQPNDLVLDPFSGSASTAVACVQTGRRCIAIEVDPKIYEKSCERVREAVEAQVAA